MHNELNMVQVARNTWFVKADKTKDNVKSRLDLAEICNHPLLNLVQNPNGTRI